MALRTDAVGKSYPAVAYAVGRERVRAYARAVGETNPLHLDPAAARAAGHRDVVAPPMFAAVYGVPGVLPAITDPEVGLDFAMLVHGAQEFRWGPLVVAGDEISTVASVRAIEERGGRAFYVFGSVSTNQDGETVCVGTWTNVARRR